MIMVFLESCVDLVVRSGLAFSYFFLGVIFMLTDSLLMSGDSTLVYGLTLTIAGFFIFLILTFGLLRLLLRLSNDVIEWSKVFMDTACLMPLELLRLL